MSARPLHAQDLQAVVAIDAALSGRARGAYFERRLAAARRDPGRHLQVGIEHAGSLAGFMIGRALQGEFGRSAREARLEAFGVAPALQRRGLGGALSAAFEGEARRRGLAQIRTSALWREHGLLRFLDRAGYDLAGDHVLGCALRAVALGSAAEEPVEREQPPRDANDYGTPLPASDFEPLARDAIDIGMLQAGDLDGIVRIDRRLTGRDRAAYLSDALAEALAGSAVRISLAARMDGGVAGYVMARLDYGDYGRAEPAALIDTLGVDPLRAHHGIGRALLSQLFVNLRALGVERVETDVAPADLDLVGFFSRAGFVPAERLSFLKQL
jgi:predicted N-acetyltransferase YhbS